MICKNTNALCINIHCSSLQQKGEVILYILVLLSHEYFCAIIWVPNGCCVTGLSSLFILAKKFQGGEEVGVQDSGKGSE